ncbi:hypothetical protein [Noviherbaspirillum saxi]|uniref:hypothetical protein n=1 Tax=Noviherbaspirillum saxi TaxID=2320863 RepID=UPI0011C3971E|nr:hypothetical protein [Noviherbaspirillum saxi]
MKRHALHNAPADHESTPFTCENDMLAMAARLEILAKMPDLVPGLDLPERFVIPLAGMLGHTIDDSRCKIAARQNDAPTQRMLAASRTPIPEGAPTTFILAPFDIMTHTVDGRLHAQLLENNDTGYIGATSASPQVQAMIWESTGRIVAQAFGKEDNPLVLVSVSGMENKADPRPNKMVHEKIATAVVIARELERRLGREVHTYALQDLIAGMDAIDQDAPAVVLGYTQQFIDTLQLNNDRSLVLTGRKVDGIHNGRLIKNLATLYGDKCDLESFKAFNPTWQSGQDKGDAYRHANAFNSRFGASFPLLSRPITFEQVDKADGFDGIAGKAKAFLEQGIPVVLKPSGTGNGKGIRFIDLGASDSDIAETVADMWREINECYTDCFGNLTAGFPITVAEALQPGVVNAPGTAMHGRTFELRFVVINDGQDHLVCAPTIAKVNMGQGRVNNVSASINQQDAMGIRGADCVVPMLDMPEVERMLGLTEAQLAEMAAWVARDMAYILSM